jgi:hypothetical protein
MCAIPAPKPPPAAAPSLELPPDLEAVYANLVRISHSPSEMVVDFAVMLPGFSGPQIKSRVLLTPLSAKLFLRALAENVAKYEENFGEIHMPGDSTLAAQLFRPPHPPEKP